MSLRFRELDDDTPYIAVECFDLIGRTHYYGKLWLRRPNGTVESCEVCFKLSGHAAARINRLDGGHTYRAGTLCNRFETESSLMEHARRQAVALWKWVGDIGKCGSMPFTLDDEHVQHMELEPDRFVD